MTEIIDPVSFAAKVLTFARELLVDLGVTGDVDAAAVALAARLADTIGEFAAWRPE